MATNNIVVVTRERATTNNHEAVGKNQVNNYPKKNCGTCLCCTHLYVHGKSGGPWPSS